MHETILTKLKAEHRQVEHLMDRIENSTDPAFKQELFQQFKHELLPHMEGEEQTLYQKLRNETDAIHAEILALEANEEHSEVKELISQLEAVETRDPLWNEIFLELKTHIKQHVEEEETELFAEAKEDFSREELESIADEFEEVKSHSMQ